MSTKIQRGAIQIIINDDCTVTYRLTLNIKRGYAELIDFRNVEVYSQRYIGKYGEMKTKQVCKYCYESNDLNALKRVMAYVQVGSASYKSKELDNFIDSKLAYIDSIS
jgi:hypothetical protein